MRDQRVATYLDRIVTAHRETARADTRRLDLLIGEAQAQPPARGFATALRSVTGLGVIAEVKRRSPSKGDLHVHLDPAELARAYEHGGAACLSVLTDREFFGGSPEDLRDARLAAAVPVLRKDFTVAAADVCDARIMGADAVLLIVAVLDDTELRDFHALAGELRLDALVEVHDEAELDRAMTAGAALVGVNQRDLVTFEVDPTRAVRVGRALSERGDDVVQVAESGIRGPEDAAVLARAGFDAVLVGESLVTSGDPAGAVRALRTASAR